MKPNSFIHIVGLQVRPEIEEKFNKWLSERHVPDLLKYKKIKAATYYKKQTPKTNKPGSPGFPDVKTPNYITIYEFENQEDFEGYETSPELDEANKETNETWADDLYERMWRVQYKAVKTWKR